jgi:flagellar basal body-associated protein FliL
MAKEVINVGGEDREVREDTAKSYRGTIWALLSVGAFVIIAAIIFFAFFLRSATDNKPSQTPAQMEERRQQ